jgi:major vault protein
MNDRARERDLILAPNEYAFIADETKGNINAYIGPYKTSLANTDQPNVFNPETKRFEKCSLEAATRSFAVAPVGWYLVLKNPAKDGSHPKTGAINNLIELEIGRKVNRPGPAAFALWPGQMVRVIQGHNLRSNQYLVVRVYDEEAARANWKHAVIKRQGSAEDTTLEAEPPDLTMGQQLVIQGTDVSFYIPSTGIEVVADEGGGYVREAVTLERLEYCILLGEDGNKTYLQGPAVVFPQPTETFVERGGANKFRAIELNENSGIYVKVIAPYQDEGVEHEVGDELFITGKDQMIYFPRPEHAVIKYGDQTIHYAVAIPAGEARYVLDRHTGQIRLERGPAIFLPDPRREVIVRRILDPRHVKLWFPGNTDALEHNKKLAALHEGKGDFIASEELERKAPKAKGEGRRERASEVYAGDDFSRSQSFTPPRTITLDTRYDGAVGIAVWTGYAVLVVSKTGERKVVVGPATHMLAYDEILQAVELSTGTPKSDAQVERTAYLRVLYNKVSDEVEAETADLVAVRIRLSYRVNFEGDPQAWFNVENYVKFLTEHLRSLLRGAIKQRTVQSFYADAVAFVRDVVLGAQGDDGKRTGRRFEENGMRVYDLELLGVEIGDATIARLLVDTQHAVVQQNLTLEAERRRLDQTREREAIAQEIAKIEAATRAQTLGLKQAEVEAVHAYDVAKIEAEVGVRKRRLDGEEAEQATTDTVHDAKLARRRRTAETDLELGDRQLAQRLRELEAEVQAVVAKAGAVSPDLIAALQAFGDRALAEKMAESMAPLAILGGESVAEVLARLLRGTKLAQVLGAQGPSEAANEGPGEGG